MFWYIQNFYLRAKVATKSYFTFSLIILILGLLSFSSNAFSASLNVRVDRTAISIDETLNLSITYNGDSKQSGPDLSQLETQFDILSRNQSSRVQYTNGSVASSTEWSYTIGPKNTGKLLIPSFKIDEAFSDAVEITVAKAATSTTSSPGKDLYIETFVNKDSVYVQEQIILTQRLFISANVNVDQLDPEALSLNNVVLEELPGAKYTKKIGHKTYYVFEYSYAIFPQSSTNIVIPSLRWNLRTAQRSRNSVFDRLGNYQIKRLRTQEKLVEVKAKPSSYPSNMPWLPATDIQLSQDWSKSTDTFKIGEPITRTLTIEAKGLTSSQLPQFIKDTNSNGIKLYVDQPQLNDEQTDAGVVGRRIESAAIVVTRNGEVTIPATRIPWWNTTSDRLEYLELEAKTLFVKGPEINDTTQNLNPPNATLLDSPMTANNPPSDLDKGSPARSDGIWKTAAIALLISTSILLAMYLRELFSRKQRRINQGKDSTTLYNKNINSSEKKSWENLQAALKSRKYSESRKLLLAWINNIDGQNLSSLQYLYATNSSEDLIAAKTGIDALLYSNEKTQKDLSSQWNSQTILDHLNKYREEKLVSKRRDQKQSPSALAPLHPNT